MATDDVSFDRPSSNPVTLNPVAGGGGEETYQLLQKLSTQAAHTFWYFCALMVALDLLRVPYDQGIANNLFLCGGVLIGARVAYFALAAALSKLKWAWDAPQLRGIVFGLVVAFVGVLWSLPSSAAIPVEVAVFAVPLWGLCYAIHPRVFYEGFGGSVLLSLLLTGIIAALVFYDYSSGTGWRRGSTASVTDVLSAFAGFGMIGGGVISLIGAILNTGRVCSTVATPLGHEKRLNEELKEEPSPAFKAGHLFGKWMSR
jgi:hypothetical protein